MVTRKTPPDLSSQDTSIIRSLSGKLTAFGQSTQCTDTPLPLVTKPTMLSPGTGLQHLAKCTTRPSSPFTRMPLLDLVFTLRIFRFSRSFAVFCAVFFCAFSSFLYTSASLSMTLLDGIPPYPTDARRSSSVILLKVLAISSSLFFCVSFFHSNPRRSASWIRSSWPRAIFSGLFSFLNQLLILALLSAAPTILIQS